MKGVEKVTVSKEQLGYARKYFQKFDDIKIRVNKGERERYKNIAEKSGMSLNAYIIKAIEEKIERDRK